MGRSCASRKTAVMLALARVAAVIQPKLREKGSWRQRYCRREGRRRCFLRPRLRARRERKMANMKAMESGMASLAKERDQPT